MRKLVFFLLVLIAAGTGARAQVAVEVTLEQDQFLPGESMSAAVRIKNRSGRTLKLGEDATWLTFTVQSHTGGFVTRKGETPVIGEFTLDSANIATKRVNLAPYFALDRPGRYTVTASLRIKEWDGVVNSPAKAFDIIDGTRVWTREFGVPAKSENPNQLPEVRNYSLLQANYLQSELKLYFRLSDASDTKAIKVFPMGKIVSFAQPDAELDAQSRVHVLYQSGARTSIYTVITPDGDIAVRDIYDHERVRPQLRTDEVGKIVVSGGVRRITQQDTPVSSKVADEAKP